MSGTTPAPRTIQASPLSGDLLGRPASTWTIIGFLLIAAAALQPLVASYLRGFTPDELLAPMQRYSQGRPLPPEIKTLFAGVFANIRFSLAFSALKLGLGVGILVSVHHLRAGKPWAPQALSVFPIIGMVAFVGIGLFFAYSTMVMGGTMSLPVVVTVSMIAMGIVVALFPAVWLFRQHRALRALAFANDARPHG